MPLFSPADIAELRTVAELPFGDAYVVLRKSPTPTRDSRGNRIDSTATDYVTVESGMGRLRTQGLQPNERIMAESLNAIAPYAIDLPIDTIADTPDRIAIGNRFFEVQGVLRAGSLGLIATAVCEERSA